MSSEMSVGRLDESRATPVSKAVPTLDLLRLAAGIGILGGYVDLLSMFFRRRVFGVYYLQGREFVWAVPLGGLCFVMVAGMLLAMLARARAGWVTRRGAAWALVATAAWGVLLRLPVQGAASLLLAVGLGRWASARLDQPGPGSRRWGRVAPIALGLVLVASIARDPLTGLLARSREGSRPKPPPGAGNVVLLVLDTVRARSLSLHGAERPTSPELARWAARGVRFDWAIAPAPWSFPSHASFFTGRSPYELGIEGRHVLETPFPTVAEYLRARGHRTIGFVANTTYCGHETRLDRGFEEYHDYVFSFRSLLASTAPGRWIEQAALGPWDAYGRKWRRFRARDAQANHAAFLDWLDRRPAGDRPYFAFLNDFDAHEPYVLPDGHAARFGAWPETPDEAAFLDDYWERDKRELTPRLLALARDAYDDCIASLDRRVGSLLDELERRGALRDTTVIVTSDHGESFGEHGAFDHGFSLHAEEVHVPLVVVGGRVPAGRSVARPVSLRDLAATIADLAGAREGSPFGPGTLSAFWSDDALPSESPAVSEASLPLIPIPTHGPGVPQKGFTMSLVSGGRHYIRDGGRLESLFDLAADPHETTDLAARESERPLLNSLQRSLLEALRARPGPPAAARDYLGPYRGMLERQVDGLPLGVDPPTIAAPGAAGPGSQ